MKDIYEMFNDIEVDENEFEEMQISEIEKERLKKRLKGNLNKDKLKGKKFSRNKKVAIAAAIVLVCVSTTIAIKPALATNIPIIGELFKKNLISVNEQYDDYVDIIGKTKSCEGIDVTFESAVADNDMIYLNFIVKNNNRSIKYNYKEVLLMPRKIRVNGKEVITTVGASWEFIDNNTIRVVRRIDLSKYKLPNEMNIDISISELFGKSGDWGVKFFIDKSRLVANTFEKDINTKIELIGEEIKISKLVFSPLTLKIKGEGETCNFSNDEYVEFIVLDQNGRGLAYEGVQQDDNKWTDVFFATNHMESITIVPVHRINSKEEGKKLPPVKLDVNDVKPIELIIDEDRSINIKDYFIDGEYLVVKFNQKYFGKDSLKQTPDMGIYVTLDDDIVNTDVDNKIKEIYAKYSDLEQYINVFKVGSSRNIKIGTYDGSNIKMLKDKSITVNINE